MTGVQVSEQHMEQIGEIWFRAITEKNFQRLGSICQEAVCSRLMTPRRIHAFENVADLIQEVAGWFQECSSFSIEQSRIASVGEKLSIFYRLSLVENGQRYVVEQQLYCSLRDRAIDQLSLLCSGFQPILDQITESDNLFMDSQVDVQQPHRFVSFPADAYLQFTSTDESGSTCVILTPLIKRKLNEIHSGQVLEVQVDDPSVKEDIEAWCRLSGNTLVKMDVDAGNKYHYYLMKK